MQKSFFFRILAMFFHREPIRREPIRRDCEPIRLKLRAHSADFEPIRRASSPFGCRMRSRKIKNNTRAHSASVAE